MSVVLWENLISRRRSRRNPAGAGIPLVRYTSDGLLRRSTSQTSRYTISGTQCQVTLAGRWRHVTARRPHRREVSGLAVTNNL